MLEIQLTNTHIVLVEIEMNATIHIDLFLDIPSYYTRKMAAL